MTKSDRPNQRPDGQADKPQRTDTGLPVSGRSASVAEIGKELGDLDFEPEDLLASLRPVDASAPDVAAVALNLDTAGLAAPKLPDWDDADWGADTASPSNAAPPLGEQFDAEEPPTRAVLPEPVAASPNPTAPPVAVGAAVDPSVVEASPQVAVDGPNMSPSVVSRTEMAQQPSAHLKRPVAPRPVSPKAAAALPLGAAPPNRLVLPAIAKPKVPAPSQRSAALAASTTASIIPEISSRPDTNATTPDADTPFLTTNEDDDGLLEELVELPPERVAALTFPLERPAFDHLGELDLIDAFHDFAVILTSEAQAPRHRQEQAELALMTSELLAMLGQIDTSREYLTALAPVTTPATSLQARQLAFAAEDRASYAQHLKGEIRTSVSHESRRHVMALYADTLRATAPHDEAEGRRHLELSIRAFPSDSRFSLQRLSAQFNERNPATKLRPVSIPDAPQLSEAIRCLSALRNGTAQRGDHAHPATTLMAARRAWQRRDLNQLAEGILDFRNWEDIAAGAAWLHACLTAYHPDLRESGNGIVEGILEGGDAEADLALLERRLHQADRTPTSVEVFSQNVVAALSAMDRLALGISVNADTDTLRVLCKAALASAPNDALGRATAQAFQLNLEDPRSIDPNSARQGLGAAIGTILGNDRTRQPEQAEPTEQVDDSCEGSGNDDSMTGRNAQRNRAAQQQQLLAASATLAQIVPSEPLPRILRFDDCISRGSPSELASVLAEVGPALTMGESPQLLLLAALLAQLDNETSLHTEYLKRALAEEATLETAIRGLMAAQPESTPSGLLQKFAERLDTSPRKAFLELELLLEETSAATNEGAPSLSDPPKQLGPLVALLSTTTGSGSPSLFQSIPDLSRQSPEVRNLVWMLDALQQSSTNEGLVPNQGLDIDFAQRDALVHDLASTFGAALAPFEIDDATLDEEFRHWLMLKRLIVDFPFVVDGVEPKWFTQAGNPFQSPILAEWHRLLHALKGGDEDFFRDLLRVAEGEQDLARGLDLLYEAAQSDPRAESALGSIEIARRALEKDGKHLRSLRIALRHEARHGAMHRMGSIAAQLARQLDETQRLAYAWLAIAATTYSDDADSSIELAIHLDTLVEPQQSPPLWVSRKLLALAQVRGDDQLLLDIVHRLREMPMRAVDAATLTLRAAEAASRLEQWDLVGELLERTVDLYPDHLVALSMRAEFLEARGELPLAAAAYDALAHAACMPAHKVAAWIQAATLWSEQNDGTDASTQAMVALEHATELDPTNPEANMRLRDQYIARGEIDKLERLLTKLLLRVDDSTERAQLELDRARALLDLGRVDEAQSGLDRALSLIPDSEQALLLSARLHEQRGDFEAAEQHWVRLASLKIDDDLQVEAYQRLAVLYETFLEQPTRAEVAYREVLKRRPNDPAAERLVQLLLRLDNRAAVVELLEQLIADASDPVIARERSLELARVFDEVINDRRRAEEILDRTRRKWPNDASTIRALAAFYRRGKDPSAVGTLLDRSLVESRRALASGRFDAAFFEVVACVAELRDEADFGAVASATLSALLGRDSDLCGVDLRAGEDPFADMLAPEVLSLPLRALLRKSGWALCAAHPIDIRALRAVPLAQHHPELSEHLRALARGFGLYEIDLFLSPALGAVCQPTSSIPAVLVVGEGYVDLTDPSVRDALAIRALRILSAHAAALANTAPVDLWPLLVGYLSCYLPQWLPPGTDEKKIAPIRERIQQALPADADRDAPMLAADVAASIGNRASQLGVAVQQWGSRTALLALGNPGTVVTAIAATLGQQDRLGRDPSDRQKWILRNAEARDLFVFSISDPYLSARARALGRDAG